MSAVRFRPCAPLLPERRYRPPVSLAGDAVQRHTGEVTRTLQRVARTRPSVRRASDVAFDGRACVELRAVSVCATTRPARPKEASVRLGPAVAKRTDRLHVLTSTGLCDTAPAVGAARASVTQTGAPVTQTGASASETELALCLTEPRACDADAPPSHAAARVCHPSAVVWQTRARVSQADEAAWQTDAPVEQTRASVSHADVRVFEAPGWKCARIPVQRVARAPAVTRPRVLWPSVRVLARGRPVVR